MARVRYLKRLNINGYRQKKAMKFLVNLHNIYVWEELFNEQPLPFDPVELWDHSYIKDFSVFGAIRERRRYERDLRLLGAQARPFQPYKRTYKWSVVDFRKWEDVRNSRRFLRANAELFWTMNDLWDDEDVWDLRSLFAEETPYFYKGRVCTKIFIDGHYKVFHNNEFIKTLYDIYFP